MNKTTNIASAIAKLSELGNYQKAAEMAVRERAEHGSTVEGAALVARRARKQGDARLVGLALCLCPEVQWAAPAMERFALLAGKEAVQFCAAHAEGLRQMTIVAKTAEPKQEVKPKFLGAKRSVKPVKLEKLDIFIIRVYRPKKNRG